MKPKRLLDRIQQGAVRNIAFRDMCGLAEAVGFELDRVSGSHRIFVHPQVPDLLDLQEVRGEAKPYQVRQFLQLVEKYGLSLDQDP